MINGFRSKYNTLPKISELSNTDLIPYHDKNAGNSSPDAIDRINSLETRLSITEKSNRALLEEVVRLHNEFRTTTKQYDDGSITVYMAFTYRYLISNLDLTHLSSEISLISGGTSISPVTITPLWDSKHRPIVHFHCSLPQIYYCSSPSSRPISHMLYPSVTGNIALEHPYMV